METGESKFDLRVIERRLREGTIEQKEYNDYLKKLPDDADNADYTEFYEEAEEKKPTSKKTHPGGPTFTSG